MIEISMQVMCPFEMTQSSEPIVILMIALETVFAIHDQALSKHITLGKNFKDVPNFHQC